MTKTLAILGLVAALAAALIGASLLTGCASAYVTSRSNEWYRQDAAVRMHAIPGGAAVSVNILAIPKGYWASWDLDPTGMKLATAVDAAVAALSAYAIWETFIDDGGGGGVASDPQVPSISQGGRGNVIQIGTGNDGQGGGRTDSHDAPAPEAAP